MKKKKKLTLATTLRLIHLVSFFVLIQLVVSCSDSDSDVVQADSPPAGTLYFFNVFGDSRPGNSIYASLISTALTAGSPDINFHLGDMINFPNHGEEWPVFDSISSPLKYNSEFYVTIGNHDVNDQQSMDNIRLVYSFIPATGYYSFLHKDTFFLILNTQEIDSAGTISAAQLTWINSQLSSSDATNAKFQIVLMHQPLYPQNAHKNEPVTNYADIHNNYFDPLGVDVVFAGHEHSYTHTIKDDIHYMITGTSGSPLVDGLPNEESFFHFAQVSVLSDRLHIKVIDLFGRTRDTIEIDPRP